MGIKDLKNFKQPGPVIFLQHVGCGVQEVILLEY